MPETRATVTIGGSSLPARDLDRVQSVTLEEGLGAQSKVSVVVSMATGARSTWPSPLDALVMPLGQFGVEVSRAGRACAIDARSVAASWTIVPGGVSTLTVEGLDRSVELDRHNVQKVWRDTTDSTIARTIFTTNHGLVAQVDSTPIGVDSGTYSPQQNGTDWAFLKALAARNGFDVYVESISGVPTGVFRKIDVTAEPQEHLALGYGRHGGRASASVQLLAGEEVQVTRNVPGTANVDVGSDDGRDKAMGSRSLGGVRRVRTSAAAGMSVLDAQTTATATAERSAFGATLTTSLTAPDAPLVRARSVVMVAGLGEILDGPWLVRSVRHTVTPGEHTQAVTLIRNALGDPSRPALWAPWPDPRG